MVQYKARKLEQEESLRQIQSQHQREWSQFKEANARRSNMPQDTVEECLGLMTQLEKLQAKEDFMERIRLEGCSSKFHCSQCHTPRCSVKEEHGKEKNQMEMWNHS